MPCVIGSKQSLPSIPKDKDLSQGAMDQAGYIPRFW